MTGYIQVRRSNLDPSEKTARSWAEIAPLVAAQASELHEKVASLGLTLEEANLLSDAELCVQRIRRGGAGHQAITSRSVPLRSRPGPTG